CAGANLDRLVDQIDGRVALAKLEGENAKQMKGIGIARLGGEDLPIQSFGLRQPAGLVVADGLLHRSGNLGRRHDVGATITFPARAPAPRTWGSDGNNSARSASAGRIRTPGW